MQSITTIQKIGNSLYFRIPFEFRNFYKIQENDVYSIEITSNEFRLKLLTRCGQKMIP